MNDRLPCLRVAAAGHHFVIYGDSCSGVAGALHERTFAQVNDVVGRLARPPQFIIYPGDEIMGLTTDAAGLRAQWQHWLTHEMAWLDRDTIPLYHTTGNHTTYNPMSEAVFREMLPQLPRNGPADQLGLSYYVRHGDLLLLFINTMWSGTGGEGTVETEWLARVLQQEADARHKLVIGHHPVFAVNGFAGAYQRTVAPEMGATLWDLLVAHEVLAYVCSHILAFDVQVQRGVLQLCTAGAGTAHRMPEDTEYLHAVQAALDDDGLRYQVLDVAGTVREWLRWPWQLPPSASWETFTPTAAATLPRDYWQNPHEQRLVAWSFSGELAADDDYTPQTLLCATAEDGALPYLWVGIVGEERRLVVQLSPRANRSPHQWSTTVLFTELSFHLTLLVANIGAGGLLWRIADTMPWTSLVGASAWGVERLPWSGRWQVGTDDSSQAWRGTGLTIRWHRQSAALSDHLLEP